MSFVWAHFCHFNVFELPPHQNEIEAQHQRRIHVVATRVYLIVLILSLTLVGLYSWLDDQVIIVTVQHPSIEQFNGLPAHTECPCSSIALYYAEFTSFSPVFHQVCQSEFVSERWINAIFSGINITYFYLQDFRTYGSAQFQALEAFCRLSRAHVQESIASFQQTIFVSSQAMSEAELVLQTQSAINQFEATAFKKFENQLELILQTTASNRLVSGLQTNFIFEYYSTFPLIQPVKYGRGGQALCSCLLESHCSSDAVFDTTFGAPTQLIHNNSEILPGMTSGCLPVSSILTSTLTCFYNQTCLDRILSFFPTTERFTAMITDSESLFGPTATVQSLVDNLLVEDWFTGISYENYYKQCAPVSCTYFKHQRHGLLSVATRLIAILSSLTMFLRIVIPFIVRFVLRNRKAPSSARTSMRIRIQQLRVKAARVIKKMNIYKRPESNDRQIHYQQLATRFYVIIIAVSLWSLISYKLLRDEEIRETFTDPTFVQYMNLEQLYDNGLSCPCTSISIPYGAFVTIEPTYHQVCSSYLISSQWIMYSNPISESSDYLFDYQFNSGSHFRTLAMFCEQAKQMINSSLRNFLATPIVTRKVIRPALLQSQMDSLIADWKMVTIQEFTRTIELIRTTTLANQLMNRLNIFYQDDDHGQRIVEPRVYGTCNCAFSRTCHTNLTTDDYVYIFVIPNFFYGCYLLEALLISTMECFYDESCMTQIDYFLDRSLKEPWSYPALDPNINRPSDNIETIVNQMMTVSWSSTVNLTVYYETCAPKSCITEYTGSIDYFTILLFGAEVFGGLSIGVKLFIFIGLLLIEKLIDGFSLRRVTSSFKCCFSCDNEQQIIYRFHLLLVAVTLSIIYSFSAFTPQTVLVEISKPSLPTYQSLLQKNLDSLRCSCSQISIQYQSFLEITPSFHPACRRSFITELWILVAIRGDAIYQNISKTYVYSAIGQLQALQSLCQLSQQTVNGAVLQLRSSHMINSELLSSTSLSRRIKNMIDTFATSIPESFINSFSLIRETTKANKLMTTFGTAWLFANSSQLQDMETLHTIPAQSHTCNCGLFSKCFATVFGVTVSCYVVEGFLQSTFECLYDQECLDRTHTILPLNNTATPSHFPMNSTVESVFQELMVEEMTYRMSYTDYYDQCAPSSCVYSHTDSKNVIDGITILISLHGGLAIICRWIAFITVKLLRYRSTRVTPMATA